MAAMNPGDMSDLELTPGTDLNLDDDALFAELDSEVLAGGETASTDMDLDLGDMSGAGAGDDLDLDLGEGSGAGGDLDLEMGEASGAAASGDELDLGDLGGDSAAGIGDDFELDLGASASDAGGGDMDLGLGADGSAGAGEEIDLDLGGGDAASDGLDLDLGTGDAAVGEMDLDLDLGEGAGETEASAGEPLDLGLGDEPELAAAGDEINLGDLGEDMGEAEAPAIGDDMESLELDVGEADLDDLDLGAVDAGLEDTEPMAELEPALEDELAAPELPVETMEIPDEPVFDMEAVPAAFSAEPEADFEFHAAEDIRLDEEPLQLEVEDTGLGMAPASAAPAMAAEEALELVDESPLDLEPSMIAEPAMDFETVSQPAPTADTEFSAVQDMHVDDDALLELNLDDVEQKAEEDDSIMMAQAHAATAMEEAIPLTEQLEIPPLARGAARAAATAPAPAAAMLNNEILMAVSHQISVQLGALSLNGKELLEIGYGSVLPLDRVIGEPVDLVLDNKTIAQAEVVLINGKNLGVRIVALNRR